MIIDQKVRIIHGKHAGVEGLVSAIYPDMIAVRIVGNAFVVGRHEVIDAGERHQSIQAMAHARWLHHGAVVGHALNDWLICEKAIDGLLAAGPAWIFVEPFRNRTLKY